MFKKLALAACVSVGAIGSAQASVILIGPVTFQGVGIGNVDTLLSLQSQGNATDEAGSVAWNGTTSVASAIPNPAGAAQPGVVTTQIVGGSNNQTHTFSSLGVTQSADLRVILNINDPANAGDVLLNALVFNAYSPTGTVVFSGSLAAPVNLMQVQSGIGVSGYAFGLDAAQAAALQAVFDGNLRFGISAALSNASGGFETFYAGPAASLTPEPGPTVKVSEPGTLALLGLALGGLAAFGRRKSG
jgi:hypothetical protein